MAYTLWQINTLTHTTDIDMMLPNIVNFAKIQTEFIDFIIAFFFGQQIFIVIKRGMENRNRVNQLKHTHVQWHWKHTDGLIYIYSILVNKQSIVNAPQKWGKSMVVCFVDELDISSCYVFGPHWMLFLAVKPSYP